VWSYAVSRAHSREATRCKTAWLASRTFGKRQVASRPHSPPRGAVKAHHNGTLLKAGKNCTIKSVLSNIFDIFREKCLFSARMKPQL
jgi:hypothetical protein